jgi:hypothetical protein
MIQFTTNPPSSRLPQLVDVESAGDGWMWGTDSSTNKRGLFPESYVLVETHTVKAKPPPIPVKAMKKESKAEAKVEDVQVDVKGSEEEDVVGGLKGVTLADTGKISPPPPPPPSSSAGLTRTHLARRRRLVQVCVLHLLRLLPSPPQLHPRRPARHHDDVQPPAPSSRAHEEEQAER